ncbi:MAG: hypothetical protein ACK4YX_03755 [Rhabdaerophilum calidifontis]
MAIRVVGAFMRVCLPVIRVFPLCRRIALGLCLVWFAAPAGAQDVPGLAWEAANRFRLLRTEQHFRELLRVYRAMPAAARKGEPAFALEDALQRLAAARALKFDGTDRDQVERYGWTVAMVGRDHNCFRTGSRNHYSCTLPGYPAADPERYMEPRRADILVRFTKPPAARAAPCRWRAAWDGGFADATAPCTGEEPVRLRHVPYERPFLLEVTGADGAVLGRASGQRLRHVFIAGIGDSFASGEGNPDKPVTFGDEVTHVSDYDKSSHLPNGNKQLYPLRVGRAVNQGGGMSSPTWLNGQCHRSLYSQQVKTALALALEQPHLVVTFTGYACTGAEIDEGLLGFWAARDDVPARFRDDAPQLVKLLRDYCRRAADYEYFDAGDYDPVDWRRLPRCAEWRSRPPDAVLLSIGGNDLGFSRVIAKQVIASTWDSTRFLYRLWLKQLDPLDFADALHRIDHAVTENGILRPALRDNHRRLAGILRRYIAGDGQPPLVLQTGYPHITVRRDSEPDDVCPSVDFGMTVHEALKIGPETGREGRRFVNRLDAALGEMVAALDDPRWHYVNSHVARFKGHGICTRGVAGADLDEAWARNSGSGDFPILRPNWRGANWDPATFRPSQWRAYRPRLRWFVTPNDGFLTGHYLRDVHIKGHLREQPLVAATLSGAFHPNALGHAAIADAVLPALRAGLGLAPPAE